MCKLNPPPDTEITRKFVCQNIQANSTVFKNVQNIFSKSGKPLTYKQHCQYTTKLNTAETRGTASNNRAVPPPLPATHRKPQTQQTNNGPPTPDQQCSCSSALAPFGCCFLGHTRGKKQELSFRRTTLTHNKVQSTHTCSETSYRIIDVERIGRAKTTQ